MRVLVPAAPGDGTDDRVTAYLALLGVPHPARPDLESLIALHRAHVARVPWSTLEMVLGWDCPADEASCVRRVLARRGGSGLHLGGAFAWLLERLGYDVTRHRAGVHREHGWAAAGVDGSHLTLTVTLGRFLRRERWLVDVGLEGALRSPVLLEEGPVQDGAFNLRLVRSAVVADGWRLENDSRTSTFAAMELALAPVSHQEAVARHHQLTGPGSHAARQLVVKRRTADGLDRLVGRRLWQDQAGRQRLRLLRSGGELADVLERRFGLDLDGTGLRGDVLARLYASLGPRPTSPGSL